MRKKQFRAGYSIAGILLCCDLGACMPAIEPMEAGLKSDSVHLEELYNLKYTYPLGDAPKPFMPKLMIMPMEDTHYFEILETMPP